MMSRQRWSAFRVTIFRDSETEEVHEFASVGRNAEKKRKQWLQMFSDTVSAMTMTLFLPHVIMVNPLPHVEATSARILAGYLLFCEALNCVSLVYCELRSYSHGEATLAVYRDEMCETEVAVLQITGKSIVSFSCCTYCNMFGLGGLRFCARTTGETEMWSRAIMNIKTKLLFDAPDPSAGELAIFREAVLQRAGQLANIPRKRDDYLQVEAMLPLKPPQPASYLPGEVWPVGDRSNTITTTTDKRKECSRETLAANDSNLITLVGSPSVSRAGVANEFSQGDSRPCVRTSHAPCWFGSIDASGPHAPCSIR